MDKQNEGYVIVDGVKTPIDGRKNLLEVIRASGVDLPTFCYHSELSVYGACRMCIAEIEGRGIQPTCSTPPVDGMVVHTNTETTMRIRRMALELMLANHHGNCQTCDKNTHCRLQELAERLGVKKVRFEENTDDLLPIDSSNQSIVRDPNKCILCGDCVRMCKEVQGIGVLDFAGRGSNARVTPAFGKPLNKVECVFCGQCASICPTGALTVKTQIDEVWNAIHDKDKTVIVQIAPAVRAALAMEYGLGHGEQAMSKAITALRRMGFDKVYDTSYTADLTTVEEATEFLGRVAKGEKLPQFTSCCPGWVKFAEQFYSEYLPNLSTCKSPQQMFGTLVKKHLSEELKVSRENIFVVSVMPCTAKKFEAKRPEFSVNGDPDVNVVLSSQELIKMIGQAGLQLRELPPGSMDLPFGFKTGAGVIFGASGGVAEAVLRLAAGGEGNNGQNLQFQEVRGLEGIKEASVMLGDKELKLAVVSGLANARTILEKIKSGEAYYDIIEVMACRGGCIGGGGQPLPNDMPAREIRKEMLYDCDAVQSLHNAADNPYVKECYEKLLGKPNSHIAHELLHTTYCARRRIDGEPVELTPIQADEKIPVSVCIGTNCYLRGSYDTLKQLIELSKKAGIADKLDFKATFCFEKCMQSPNVQVGDEIHGGITPDKVEEFFNLTIKPLVESEASKH
ncbi:MAG: [FeFe] hydrogenase, group A [Armatimonadota bacterium]